MLWGSTKRRRFVLLVDELIPQVAFVLVPSQPSCVLSCITLVCALVCAALIHVLWALLVS